ncbi:MAG: hypothetical protein IKB16_09635 [Lentisphaeria bacterium]|nr:hypothetical protein [Lentisphaeria bacterium]
MTQALHKISGGFRNFPGYVFPVDTRVSFQLSVENEFIRTHHDSIRVQYIRDDWRVEDGSIAYWEPDLLHYWQQVKYVYQDGILFFELTLSGEHEHWIGITAETETDLYSEEFALCTLQDDLLQYFPFKGNVHTHSTGSDGIYPPQIVAARMRRAGFDFTAVTDHHKYTPSLEAIAAITPLGSGLECYRGEEAENMGPGMTHILSLGAKSSISDWKNDQTGNFLQKMEALKKHLPADLPEHERTYIAQFETIAARIREQGGLAVFCHPYWRQCFRFAATNLMADTILRRGNFDAVEWGNYNVARTALINAKYMELVRECGFNKPVLGSADWHRDSQRDNVDYNIIFAKSPAFEDFADAVKNNRCVAVGGAQDSFPFGSFRHVKYAIYLMEHYFHKFHDPLCFEQGELLLKALDGDHSVLPRIAELRKELQDLPRRFFIRSKG